MSNIFAANDAMYLLVALMLSFYEIIFSTINCVLHTLIINCVLHTLITYTMIYRLITIFTFFIYFTNLLRCRDPLKNTKNTIVKQFIRFCMKEVFRGVFIAHLQKCGGNSQ